MTELSDSNFADAVSTGKVLVDFWAEWCGPCRALSPVLEEISSENPIATIAKLNVDDNPLTTKKYGIRSIPTVLLFENGVLKDKFVGTKSKNEVVDFLNS